MRRFVAIVMLLGFLSLFFLQMPAEATGSQQAKSKVAIGINDTLLNITEASAVMEQNQIFVPLQVFNKMNLQTQRQDDRVLVYQKENKLIITLSKQTLIDSQGVKKQVVILVKNGVTYFPAAMIGSYFGYGIHFLKTGPVVRIKDEKAQFTDGTFIVQNKNRINTFYAPPVKKNKPIYLTFDDGPGPYMDSILSTLAAKKAKATFFLIEPQMRANPAQVKRLVREGHYPALHSVSHDRAKLYGRNTSAVAAEMETTRKTLLKLTGVNSKLTRVPYGSKPYMKLPYRNSLVSQGYKMWDWNIDTEDWRYQKTNPNRIIQNCLTGLKSLKGNTTPAVVLFHVNKGTASVLPRIIDSLKSQGYDCAAYNPKAHFVLNFWGDKRL